MFDRTNAAIAASLLVLGAAPAWADGACRLPDPNKGSISVNNRSSETIEGSGRITEDKRQLAGFKSLKVSGPFDIELRAGDREGVTVRADDNLQAVIDTRVAGDSSLDIQLKPNASFRTRTRPRVVVEFTRMDAVSLSGSGDVIADRIRADAFAVSISGSNDMCIETIETGTFGLSIAGSGDFRAKGSADVQGIRIAGSGDADLRDLAGRVVKISIAGSGDVRVNASEALEVSIAGSGDVLYRGEPKIKRSIAGSGEVRRMK
jgi:Putative auto-transporter adhesin, head GIN domain